VYNLKITEQQVSLVDQVEEALNNYFRTMHFKPGDSIPGEQKLAEAIGVGKSVIREALSRLRMLGLIESRPRRGLVLTEPSILSGFRRVINTMLLSDEMMLDLLGFRISLEIGIADLVFQNVNEKHLQDLEEIVERGAENEFSEYSHESEYEFHSKLYEITGNDTIIEFQEIIHPVLLFLNNKFKDYFLPINIGIAKSGKLVSHRDLVNCLKNGDREGFNNCMVEQFRAYLCFIESRRTMSQRSESPTDVIKDFQINIYKS
jgi:DNA-binding FadR family transcriptional regulator